MSTEPTWQFPLNYDFRQMLDWALRSEVGVGDELRQRLREAIDGKAPEIVVTTGELMVLQLLGIEADRHGQHHRITAGNFLSRIEQVLREKPTGTRSNGAADAQPRETQGLLFGDMG